MYGVCLLFDELRRGKRFICTNLALNLPECAAYLAEKYGSSFDIGRRVRVLDATDCMDFWNHPAPGLDLEGRWDLAVGYYWSQKENNGKGGKLPKTKNVPDFSGRGAMLDAGVKNPDYVGTLFFIDEVHEFFNSRNWQSASEDALFYITQHRKYSDDVVLMTPNMSLVDKQFRECAQDFTRLRNLSKEMMGLIRLPQKILGKIFLRPPTSGNDVPMRTFLRSIDVAGIGRCYDTAAGVGVVGSNADAGARKRGIDWRIALVGFAGVVALVAYLLVFGIHRGTSMVKGMAHVSVQTNLDAFGKVVVGAGKSSTTEATRSPDSTNALPEIYLTGIAGVGELYHFYFSDWSVLSSTNPAVRAFGSDWVQVNRQMFRLRHHAETNVAPAVAPASGPVIYPMPETEPHPRRIYTHFNPAIPAEE